MCGFPTGYGLFDFLRVVAGFSIFMEDHLERFEQAVEALGLLMPESRESLHHIIAELIRLHPLQAETILERLAEENLSERLLVSFQSVDSTLSAAGHLSTAPLASTTLAVRNVLPAHSLIFFVGLVVEKPY